MSALDIFFYLNGAVAILSAAIALTRKNAVHALLFLVLSALALAIAIYLLNAPVAAALEVIVYAGAIIVLFVFAVMLLDIFKKEPKEKESSLFFTIAIASFLALLLLIEVIGIVITSEIKAGAENFVSVKELALSVFGEFGLMVEISSMILLAGLVGAYHVGKKLERK